MLGTPPLSRPTPWLHAEPACPWLRAVVRNSCSWGFVPAKATGPGEHGQQEGQRRGR